LAPFIFSAYAACIYSEIISDMKKPNFMACLSYLCSVQPETTDVSRYLGSFQYFLQAVSSK
jgi:hypothetical protein